MEQDKLIDMAAVGEQFRPAEIQAFLDNKVWRCIHENLRLRLEFLKSDLATDMEASLEIIRMKQARVEEVTAFLLFPEALTEGAEDASRQDTTADVSDA